MGVTVCTTVNHKPFLAHYTEQKTVLNSVIALTFASCLLLVLGQTGQFLRLIIYTSLMFLTLQCFLQIPFAYIPPQGENKTLVTINEQFL